MTRKSNEVVFFSIGFVIESALAVILYCYLICFNRQDPLNRQSDDDENRIYKDFETQSVYDDTLSNLLQNEVKILCMVMTHPDNHASKAIHVKNTWGQKCNKLLFMSSETDDQLDIVVIPIENSRASLWNKTRAGFVHVHEHYIDEYDWFMKADDDT